MAEYSIHVDNIQGEDAKAIHATVPFTVKEDTQVTEILQKAILEKISESCDLTLKPGSYTMRLMLAVTEGA